MKVGGVLVAGAAIADLVVRPVDRDAWGTTTFVESIGRSVGGNGANTSLALARLGVPVSLAGFVGEDDAAAFLRERLEAGGVDLRMLRSLPGSTAQTIVLVNSAGDRKFLHQMGAGAQAFEDGMNFAGVPADVTHFHLASLFIVPHLRKNGAALLSAARQAGLTTSFDTNWDPLGRWMEDCAALMPHLDLLFMNEDESRMMTGTSDTAAAARIVRSLGVKTAVMKLSNRGCAVFTDGETVESPAFPVQAIDSTGAGDCFVAGFLAALHRGGGFNDAARFANAVGALNVQSVGAVTGLRSYDEVLAWMEGR